MSAKAYMTQSLIFVLVLAAVVITVAGYYARPSQLINQIALIAGPSLLPFAILETGGARGRGVWCVFAALLVIAWGYVAYVDSRPYQGGGASFAVFAGWLGSAFACLMAVLFLALRRFFPGILRVEDLDMPE